MLIKPIHVIGPIVSAQAPQPAAKPIAEVRGMYGIGDCLFERAVLKKLMETRTVVLDSYYSDMFWDLQAKGLKLNIVQDRGRIKDDANRSEKREGVKPVSRLFKRDQIRITYSKEEILQSGSILAAMFKSANLAMPREPDFSLPIKQEWIASWRSFLAKRKISVDKPLAVYRPIVLNDGWTAPARAPDPEAYAKIFASVRNQFFWVSVAALNDKGARREWVVGRRQEVDLALESGELDFKTMAGLFASAKMVFANPGFVPVLAHSCRTPVAIVYGANESFRTTNSVGRHLSPTLAIDLDKPCEHHEQHCRCSKHITTAPAISRLEKFAEAILTKNPERSAYDLKVGTEVRSADPKVLIFGTCYADTKERLALTNLWGEHHKRLNPDCDLLLVDSHSPMIWGDGNPDTIKQYRGLAPMWSFPDNIGHLSRNGPKGPSSGGRDGWGRAFSKGLEVAIEKGYDYVVHVEGDSLLKHPVRPIIQKMIREGYSVLAVPVQGTKRTEESWVETGLMFFSVPFLKRSEFVKNYSWEKRQAAPTPERVIHAMLSPLGAAFKMESWGAYRGDKNQINADNICQMDWVTHVRNKEGLDDMSLFEKFSRASGATAASTDRTAVPPETSPRGPAREEMAPTNDGAGNGRASAKVKINLGCGTNRLDGWDNHDADVDITRPLRFAANSADFIFAEHVVEHVDYYAAIRFFKEAARVLKPGGVIRITGPSLYQIYDRGDDPEYLEFVHSRKWAPTKDLRGAMHAILFCHGHKTAWTEELMRATLYYAGFKSPETTKVGWSRHPELKGVEGHGRVIGDKFNSIESIAVEAVVDK